METFIINNQQGKRFSKLSGDYNKIHLDKKYGYNSQFGENIVHGSLVIIKILSILKKDFYLNRNFRTIDFKFVNFIKYNNPLKFIKINNFSYNLIQNKKILVKIEISQKKENFTIKKIIKRKRINLKIDNKLNLKNLKILLMKISHYVGMIYPGENSLIRNIRIQYCENDIYQKKIVSWKDDKRIPLIKNNLIYNNYDIYFESIERPVFKKRKIRISKSLRDKVLNSNGNYLIIGGSSGIGNEILNLLSLNKKNKIISTYNKNKLENLDRENIKQIKLNVEKDISRIRKIVLSGDFTIYYFATPRILSDKKNEELKKTYIKFYINFVIKLLRILKKSENKYNFFYPSTDFINQKVKNLYTKIKYDAEKEIKKELNQTKNINGNILRIPSVHTKQNISMLKNNYPSFIKLLNNNNYFQKKILFK